MFEIISNIHKALSLIKNFRTGYVGDDACDGYMFIEYKDKRYAVKIVEMSNEDQEVEEYEALDNVKKYL